MHISTTDLFTHTLELVNSNKIKIKINITLSLCSWYPKGMFISAMQKARFIRNGEVNFKDMFCAVKMQNHVMQNYVSVNCIVL